LIREWFLGARNWGGVGDRKLAFSPAPAGHAPLQADWALGTEQAIDAHTGAGGECEDAIEADVGAGVLARIHTDTGSGGLGRKKSGDGAAYVMPGRASRTANKLQIPNTAACEIEYT